MSFQIRARARITMQLWEVQSHLKPTVTLAKDTVVTVLRKAPTRDYVVVFHEGRVHQAFAHHLELVQA